MVGHWGGMRLIMQQACAWQPGTVRTARGRHFPSPWALAYGRFSGFARRRAPDSGWVARGGAQRCISMSAGYGCGWVKAGPRRFTANRYAILARRFS